MVPYDSLLLHHAKIPFNPNSTNLPELRDLPRGGGISPPILFQKVVVWQKNCLVSISTISNSAHICKKSYPLNASKYPKSTLKHWTFFDICIYKRNAFFSFFGSKNAQKRSKMPSAQVLFDFRQLLFYDLPPKNASKYPKIAIFRFANIVIFKIRLLWEPKNAPKPIFFPNQSLGVTTHM